MLSNNPFEQEFIQFKESTLFEGLARKYQPTPYYKKYGLIRKITLISSYGFNLLSGVTASTLIFLFLKALLNTWILALIITTSSILILELLKRKLGSIIFKEYLIQNKIQWMTIMAFATLSCISILSSYYGSKKMIITFSADSPLVSNDSAISTLELELMKINQQIDNARATRWKGTTTTKSQQTINSLSNQKELILSEIFRVNQKTDILNDQLKVKHEQKVMLQANHFAIATLLFELFFLICTYYLEFYDYRSYVEFLKFSTNKSTTKTPSTKTNDSVVALEGHRDSVATNSIDPSILIGAIKNAKANLDAYRNKLQLGKGTEKTNRAGIKRWESKITELKDLLPKNGKPDTIN